MWSFSNHIIERIEEREISKKEILSIVNNDVNIIVIPSKKDKTVDLYFGVVNNKYILVVVNRETSNLITIRKMRNNEKTVFDKAGRKQDSCSPMQPKAGRKQASCSPMQPKEIINGKIQD